MTSLAKPRPASSTRSRASTASPTISPRNHRAPSPGSDPAHRHAHLHAQGGGNRARRPARAYPTEPCCIAFDVSETAPGVFTVAERFADRAAFDAHQTRTRASAWWQATGHMPREFATAEE